MTAQDFIKAYEAALASQEWDRVAPLVHTAACVTFSDGTVYKGIDAVGAAYRRNFALIQNERYTMSDIHWVSEQEQMAVYLFLFNWSGIINGQPASGAGTGTAVITHEGGQWLLLAEHLGKAKG